MSIYIDVSSNNHPHNEPILYNVAVTFGEISGVYVKVTESTSYINPWRNADAKGFADQNCKIGYYHFARPLGSDPIAQAEFFLKFLPPTVSSLPLALDLEDGAQLGWRQLAAWENAWIQRVLQTGFPVCLYVNRYYLQHLGGLVDYDRLWLAAPTVDKPPDCWLWQYGQDEVTGMLGQVDLNRLVTAPPAESNGGRNLKLNSPIVGPPIFTVSGDGYWLIAADGGIFAFGDAEPFGAQDPLPGMPLNAPITGAARSPAGHGLLLVAADGGTFTFGDAPNYGSIPGLPG